MCTNITIYNLKCVPILYITVIDSFRHDFFFFNAYVYYFIIEIKGEVQSIRYSSKYKYCYKY